MIGFASAGCIDINSENLEELDEIVWVGPATAQKIIDARPFDCIDDLDSVSGIGEIKLADIKAGGVACVNEGDKEEGQEEIEVEDDAPREDVILLINEPEVISLNRDAVEDTDSLVYVSKNARVVGWLPYGFALFLIFVIGILLWERF